MFLAAIQGPSGSAYEGGVFFISILIPLNFPFQPPACYFLTPIFHPNIGKDGKVSLDILDEAWSPIWTLEQILMGIVSILGDPDWNCSCRLDVSYIYNKDPIGLNAMSRILTQRFAGRSKPPEKLFQQYEHEIFESLKKQNIFPEASKAAQVWTPVKSPLTEYLPRRGWFSWKPK